MSGSFARFATVALAAPLALALAASGARAADPTCVGTTTTGFYCDPQLTYGGYGVGTTNHTETVCLVVTCSDVTVPLPYVTLGGPFVCASWTDRAGNRSQWCAGGYDDVTICAVLVSAQGTYGPLLIDEGGDVYLFGDTYDYLWWDCAPYENPPL